MIACVDVGYQEAKAMAACLLFTTWTANKPAVEVILPIYQIEPYESGQFYKRELPCILQVLKQVKESIDILVIDGYVWLGAESKKGLGACLYEALEQKIPVIGVAKTSFYQTVQMAKIHRGQSQNPLYISAIGVDIEQAKQWVDMMHGPYRIPTLLKRVDQLSRSLF